MLAWGKTYSALHNNLRISCAKECKILTNKEVMNVVLVLGHSIQTCTLDHNKGTNTFALFSTSTLDQSLVTEKPSNGVSVCVVKFPLLTLRVSNDLSYIVPAAPAFCGHPKLCPPDECEKVHQNTTKGVRISLLKSYDAKRHMSIPKTRALPKTHALIFNTEDECLSKEKLRMNEAITVIIYTEAHNFHRKTF